MSASKNLEYEKTSFLNKSNSAFIERMYLKFVNKDEDLPDSWRDYFEGIGDELNIVAKEINGPSWGPKNDKIDMKDASNQPRRSDYVVPLVTHYAIIIHNVTIATVTLLATLFHRG